ncbi:MAG: hypothetical protein ABSH00_09990 [Bryobacteraceae bacterium]
MPSIPALIAFILSISALSAQSAPTVSPLPKSAFIVERAEIPNAVHPGRELVLWMISPEKHDRGPLSEAGPYTCPEVTLGSYYSGPTRMSLVDTAAGRVINTIRLTHDSSWEEDSEEEDSFDIPYRILSGDYYLVPGHPKGTEGKPALLALRDLNGDGLALETAFFEQLACMGLPTTLVGYSLKQDRVIQYQAELEVTTFKPKEGRFTFEQAERLGPPEVEIFFWVDYLFDQKPIGPGHWKYETDYGGRGGCLDSYDIRYDSRQEKFVGTLSHLCQPAALDSKGRLTIHDWQQ